MKENQAKPLNPGDEAKPGTPGICPECDGKGKTARGESCRNCGGTGKVVRGIGGA